MKATEQYFPVVLFIMLYKVDLTFESVDEILKCDHSIESCRTYFSLRCLFLIIYFFTPGGNSIETTYFLTSKVAHSTCALPCKRQQVTARQGQTVSRHVCVHNTTVAGTKKISQISHGAELDND